MTRRRSPPALHRTDGSAQAPALAEWLDEEVCPGRGVNSPGRDGTVAMNPIWYEQRDHELWLNSYRSALWPKRLVREGAATVLVVDPADALRHAEFRCELVGVSTDGALEHIDRLAVRYLGTSYTGPHQERLIIRLVPRRVSAQITRPRAAGPDRETTR
jgi:hypothetical protein